MQAYLRQHSSLIKIFTIVLVCLIVTTSFVYSAMKKDITILDNDSSKSISTFKATVADVLKENNIQLAPYDLINVKLEEKLTDGTQISITRAKLVTVKTSEMSKFLYTTADDVKTLLEEAGVTVGQLDKVEPSLDAAIADDMTVKVVRVTEEIVDETVAVEYITQVVKNDKLDIGNVKVVQNGQEGQKQISTRVTYEDGKEVKREVVGETVLKQAVNKIVEEGSKTTLVTSRGATLRFTKSMTVSATAYDVSVESCGKSEDHPQYGITASGIKVRPGIIAVDPKVIPLGTWVYIEGYGEMLAADTGGAIKGNKVDIYFEDSSVVKKFGRKKLKIYILDKPRYKF